MGNEIERKRPGRPCSVCSSDRAVIEQQLLAGVPVGRIVSQQSLRVSRDSIYRHIQNHMSPQLVEALRQSGDYSPADLIVSAAEVARRAEEIAQRAYTDGRDIVALRAGDALVRALALLGLRDLEPLEIVGKAEKLARAVVLESRTSPELGALIVARLADDGDIALADELAEAINPQSKTTREAVAS